MKKAKQFLSLMLVVVMVLGMMVFVPGTASAKNVDDYPDAGSIEYKEAVDVLSALGVLTGDESGAFNPKSNITREQAAKIITYILIGTTSADRLVPRTSSFTDVETSRWSNPYIEYCVEKGIIKGYGDGRFGPSDPVTAAQMAKMLLMCVGYGGKGEYDNPDSWQLNTIVDGQKRGILTIDKDFTQPASREEVAQYTFNAMTHEEAFLVTYSDLVKEYLPRGSSIFTSESQTYLGAETFKLGAEPVEDDFGRGLHYWYVDVKTNDITGEYNSDNILGTFVAGSMNATKGTFYSNYKWNSNPESLIDVYVNGSYVALPVSFFSARGSNDTPVPAGAFIEVVDDSKDNNHDNEVDKIIITYEILAQVATVVPFNGTVTLQGYDIGSSDISKLYPNTVSIFATGYSADDYVLVKPRNDSTVGIGTSMSGVPVITLDPIYTAAPLEINPAERFEDTLVAYTSTPNSAASYPTITFGSKTYNVSAGIGLGSAAPLFGDTTAAYFLDSHEQVIGFVAQSSAASTLNYVYITQALIQPINSLTGNSVKVAGVHTDGRVEVFNLATNAAGTIAYGPNGNIDLYNSAQCTAASSYITGWYSYTINANGGIRLTNVISTPGDRGYAQALTAGETLSSSTAGTASISVNGIARRATSSTLLSVVNSGTRKAYTGFANFPQLKATDLTVATGGTQILVVYGRGEGTSGTIAAIYAINGGISVVPTYGVVLGLDRTIAEGYEYSVLVGGETRKIVSEMAVDAGAIIVVDDDNDISNPNPANVISYGTVLSVDSGYIEVMTFDDNFVPTSHDYYYYDDDCVSADVSLAFLGSMFAVPGFRPTATTLRDNELVLASFAFDEDNTIHAVSFTIIEKL